MSEPSERFKDLDYLVKTIGLPAVMLFGVLWFMKHEWVAFRTDITWKLERSIRNERAIMQKMGIPVILDSDKQK